MMNSRYPTIAEMAQYLAVDLGSIEVVKWELYDYLLYPTAGQLQMPFFLNGLGQGLSSSPGNANAPKAITDTNLTGAGVLPSPQAFWIENLEVAFDPGSVNTANTFTPLVPSVLVTVAAATVQAGEYDINAFYTTGALQLNVSQKPYYQAAPLHRAPPTDRVQLDVAVATTSATPGEIVKSKTYATGRTLKLDPGIGVMTAQNFGVGLTWPALVATPSGFNGRVGCILSGWLFRGVQ